MKETSSISKIDSLEKQVGNLSKLVEINGIINSTLNINRLLSIIMEMIKDIMAAETSSLLLYDEMNMELVFKVALGEAGEELREKYRVKLGQGIAGWVALNRKSLLVNDVYNDSRFDPMYDKSTGFTTRSILCAPLLFKGKLLGVIQAINPVRSDEFNNDDMNLFLLFANQAALAVQNAIFFQKAIEDERLESELKAAKNIQVSLTPDLGFSYKGFTSAARSIPAREVGGVFHMFREYGKGVYLMTMGSVDHKGIPGALRASTISGIIRVMTELDVRNPAEIIDMTNRLCVAEKFNDSSLSLFICFVDLPNQKIEFVNSGDICPLIIRDGVARYLRLSDKSRSEMGRTDFRSECVRIQIQPGDRFVMISGSIRELKNSDGKKAGLSRIAKFLENSKGDSSELIDSLLSFTENYTGGFDRRKDMSVLAFTFEEEL
ncbi:MAG TPA: GAF domain-containing protein [Spirochaetota bacterium]|nr:GAF domain-containing protein [Spirochaetota bacterium]